MTTFRIGYNLNNAISELTLTASSNNTNYPIGNALNFRNLLRHYRSLVTSSVNIVGSWPSARNMKALMLNDINFLSVTIQGNTTNSWSSPPFSQSFTAANDPRVNRYKLYAVLSSFNYAFFRIVIPSQTPVDGASYFKIGTIVPIIDEFLLAQNPDFGYSWVITTPEPRILQFPSGQTERTSNGTLPKLKFSFSFDIYEKANEGNIYQLARVDRADFITLYENLGDVSKCCLCYRNTDIEVTWKIDNYVSISRIDFEEAV